MGLLGFGRGERLDEMEYGGAEERESALRERLANERENHEWDPVEPRPVRVAPEPRKQELEWLLTRIGSWTNARWDQHLRNEFGDERTNAFIAYLDSLGIRPYRSP